MHDQIARIIYFHRKRSGLSQLELARLANVGKTVVFDLEKGKPTVKLQTVLAVLHALNIKIRFESPLMKELEHLHA